MLISRGSRLRGNTIGAVLLVLAVSVLEAQERHEGGDTGSTNPLDLLRDELANRLEQIGRFVPTEERIRAMSLYEREVDQSMSTGQITAAQAYNERYLIAKGYWDLKDFGSAHRVGMQVIDESGDSVPAARSWFMIGMIHYGNFQDPAGAREPFKNARDMLARMSAGSASLELMSLRSKVLGHGADVNRLTNNFETAREYLDELLEDPEVVKATSVRGMMNYNLAMARTLTELGELPLAQKHYDEANRIAESSKAVNTSQGLALQLETIARKWRTTNDAERIQALEKLWYTERLKDEPLIFRVGNELTLYYFFLGTKPDKFAKIEGEFLKRIREFVAPEELDLLPQTTQEMLITYYGQNLLLAMEFAQSTGKVSEVAKLKKEFQDNFARRTFRISLPPGSPREYLARISGIYGTFFGRRPRESDVVD